jgi:SAM-dependent methyltransferase
VPDAKPRYPGRQFGDVFHDATVAARYRLRPSYPPQTFAILAGLIRDTPRAVLDVGAGRGELARQLLTYADRVDALDPSAAMIQLGQQLPGGADPRLRWLHGYAEDTLLDGPYALITAGSSLHWMEWPVVLPRFAALLAPHGSLAVLAMIDLPRPWDEALLPVIRRYSMNKGYVPYDLIAHLESLGLYAREGDCCTAPVPFAQPIAEYVEAFHSMSSFSRERMPAADADAFDAAVRALVTPYTDDDGQLTWPVSARITWGKPLAGAR